MIISNDLRMFMRVSPQQRGAHMHCTSELRAISAYTCVILTARWKPFNISCGVFHCTVALVLLASECKVSARPCPDCSRSGTYSYCSWTRIPGNKFHYTHTHTHTHSVEPWL